MRATRVRRVRARFAVEPTAMEDFYGYVHKSAFSRDIGLAFGDLARFGREIVTAGLTLAQAGEVLCILARDRKLQKRVARVQSKRADKALHEQLVVLLGGRG